MELQLVQQLQSKNGYLVFDNTVKVDITDVKTVDYVVIDLFYEHRLPLVAKTILLSEEFADVLMVYNNLTNPFYLPAGTRLKVPDLTAIESKVLALINGNNRKRLESNKLSSLASKNSLNAKTTASSNTILSDGRIIFRKQ